MVALDRTVTQATSSKRDPHLGLAIPDLFYEAHGQTPEMEITGTMVPGLPFLVSCHNTKITWGITSLHAGAGDYYSEKLDYKRKLVQIADEWQPLNTRKEGLEDRFSEETFFTEKDSPWACD